MCSMQKLEFMTYIIVLSTSMWLSHKYNENISFMFLNIKHLYFKLVNNCEGIGGLFSLISVIYVRFISLSLLSTIRLHHCMTCDHSNIIGSILLKM